MPSLPAQPTSPSCWHKSLRSKRKAPAWLFPFCSWFSHPEEKGSDESKCGRQNDGQIRNKRVDTVKGEKSMSLLKKKKKAQSFKDI